MLDTLFVYGTLRRSVRHPMAHWLKRRARHLGPASVRGRLYAIDRYPGLVLDPARLCVIGELYCLRRPAAALRELDRYEGCAPGQLRPYEFIRREVLVDTAGRGAIPAWVYLYNRPVEARRLIPTGDFSKRKVPNAAIGRSR